MTRRRAVIAGVIALAVLALGGVSVALFGGGRAASDSSVFVVPSRSAAPDSPSSAPVPASSSPSPSALPDGSTLPPASVPGAGSTPVSWWRPSGVLSWQWQLEGKLDTGVPAQVYDVDAVTTSAAEVATLHQAGRKVICYVNAGAYEDFRPDKKRYPSGVLGKGLDGWPGERWLDVRRWDELEPILRDRFAGCRQKGFDAVEPDNVDGFANQTGFPLTADDQITFNRHLADLAHRYGLAVGLKNDVEQAASLTPWFDFSVDEECARYAECDRLRVFTAAGKPVFHVEYDEDVAAFCPGTKPLGFSSMRKHVELDAWRQPC